MNFGLRLDEILFCLTDQSAWDLMGITQEQANELSSQLDRDRAEAKQAITSLFKELVAEAEPGTWVDPEDTDDLEWQGYVNGVEHFEQNLLKALEEV